MTSATDLAQRHIAELTASGLSERTRDAISLGVIRVLSAHLSATMLLRLNAPASELGAARELFARFIAETCEQWVTP